MTKPIPEEKPIKMQAKEFTGTIESFEEMAKHLGLNVYKMNFYFLDKDFQPCSMFQGIVKVNDVVYRKGDHYTFPVID